MCLIIASRDGKKPSEEILYDGFHSNKDGYGMVYLDKGKIVTRKGFTYENFVKDFGEVSSPYVLHFRWATHGLKNVDNCHPFKVRKGLYMAHNGILSVPIIDDNYSDTWNFVRYILRPQVSAFNGNLHGKGLLPAIEEFIGKGNKLAFMDRSGEITLVNEKSGCWYEGMWFSNEMSLPYYQGFLSQYLKKSTKRDTRKYKWSDFVEGNYSGEGDEYAKWLLEVGEELDKPHGTEVKPFANSIAEISSRVRFVDKQQCDYCTETDNDLYHLKDNTYNCYLCRSCYEFWTKEAEMAEAYA